MTPRESAKNAHTHPDSRQWGKVYSARGGWLSNCDCRFFKVYSGRAAGRLQLRLWLAESRQRTWRASPVGKDIRRTGSSQPIRVIDRM